MAWCVLFSPYTRHTSEPQPLPRPRLPQDTLVFREELDVLKFLCKDLWVAAFRKQMDGLRTNHQVGMGVRGLPWWAWPRGAVRPGL